uniref:hypothetical protein n=1 Tax=Paracoccus marcusii TaxID=59779 RepID=UPI00155D8F36|nr:hypothetical protein [Paracoccus marcusii]
MTQQEPIPKKASDATANSLKFCQRLRIFMNYKVYIEPSHVFDSWATRFGALSILTAAKVYFVNQPNVSASLLFGIFILSLSCFHMVIMWIIVSFAKVRDTFKGSALSDGLFFVYNLSLCFIVFLGLFLSTVAISFYSSQENAEGVSGWIIVQLSWITGNAEIYKNWILLGTIFAFAIYFAVDIIKRWRKTKSMDTVAISVDRPD